MFRFFVPRSTFDAALERIAELKAEIARLQADHERTVDLLSCRAIGQTMYGRIHPPKEVEEEPEPQRAADPSQPDAMPTPLENDIAQRGTKARALVRAAQARNMEKVAAADSEVDRILAIAQQKGYELAEVTAAKGAN